MGYIIDQKIFIGVTSIFILGGLSVYIIYKRRRRYLALKLQDTVNPTLLSNIATCNEEY